MARNNYNRYAQPYLPPQSGGSLVYQPSFDANSTVNQMLVDDFDKSQQRYDVGRQKFADFKGVVGGMDTYSPDLLQNRLGEFSDDVSGTVQEQYGGDWGLAANDIVEMIADERANPLYKAIDYQNKEADLFRKAEMQKLNQGERFVGKTDPGSVDLGQYVGEDGQIDSKYMQEMKADYLVAPDYDKNATNLIKDIPSNAHQYFRNLSKSEQELFNESEGVSDFIVKAGYSGNSKKLKGLEDQLTESLYSKSADAFDYEAEEAGFENGEDYARSVIRNKIPQLSHKKTTVSAQNVGGKAVKSEEPTLFNQNFYNRSSYINKQGLKEYSKSVEKILPNSDLNTPQKVMALQDANSMLKHIQSSASAPTNADDLRTYSKNQMEDVYTNMNQYMAEILKGRNFNTARYGKEGTPFKGSNQTNQIMKDMNSVYDDLSPDQQLAVDMFQSFRETDPLSNYTGKKENKKIGKVQKQIKDVYSKLGYGDVGAGDDFNKLGEDLLPAMLNSQSYSKTTQKLPIGKITNAIEDQFEKGNIEYGTIEFDGESIDYGKLVKDLGGKSKFKENFEIQGIDLKTGKMIGTILDGDETKEISFYMNDSNRKGFSGIKKLRKNLDENGYDVTPIGENMWRVSEQYVNREDPNQPFIDSRVVIVDENPGSSREDIHNIFMEDESDENIQTVDNYSFNSFYLPYVKGANFTNE